MKSLWMDDYDASRPIRPLKGDVETDTAIVGGGLAGVLCAYLLGERGIDTAVVEAKRIGCGVTANTTAKITAQHALIYSTIEKQYGIQAAGAYLRANQEAVAAYRRLARDIPCDFEEKTAYTYSTRSRQKLQDEADIYRRIGIDPVVVANPPIPVKTVGALGMQDQAQFHPIKFLNGIAGGLRIYEDSFVTEVRPGEVITNGGSIRAKRIILATHYPMVDVKGLYFMKLYQHRSYVLGLTGAQAVDGMYIDEQQDGLSFRMHGEHLLLGGGSHKTGKKGGGWDALRRVADAAYPGAQQRYAWATQDCMTLDSMPYIGRHTGKNRSLYVVTGFNKWGIAGCMVAAKLLSELIDEGSSRYADLFSPSRSMLHPQVFVNAGQAALGLVSVGKRCPHMGCALKWNRQERTWDCPCHGSRFDRKGRLINNPAQKGIRVE